MLSRREFVCKATARVLEICLDTIKENAHDLPKF